MNDLTMFVEDYEKPYRFEIVKDLLNSYGIKTSCQNSALVLKFIEEKVVKNVLGDWVLRR